MNLILDVKNLSKEYNHKEVLNNINIQVYEGDIYGFIGPNGAGKTTTIKTILGLLKPSKGEVYIDGKDILKDKSNIALNVGAMIDYPSFYLNLSGYKNLMLYANMLNLDKKRVNEVLELVDLLNAKDKKVSKYSMGMKQRLAVARAFLSNPKIIILDEPTNGLDPKGVKDMRELIKNLASNKNITFIYCSHILNEVQNLCNRVAIINKGQILVEDSIENLLNNDKETYKIQTTETDRLKKILSKSDFKVIDISDGIIVEIKNGTFKVLNDLISNNNIDINSISKNNRTLESYFMERVGL